METQDGFIVGVYNYCDRWCERCPLSSRCRVFAEDRQLSLTLPATGEDIGGRPVLRSLGAVAAAFEELRRGLPREDRDGEDTAGGEGQGQRQRPAALPRELPLPEADLHRRVHDLGLHLWDWPPPDGYAGNPVVRDAVDVIRHFAMFIGPKAYRALLGREEAGHLAPAGDASGSAKAALLALDRLGDAWLSLAEEGAVGVLDAEPIIAELQRLTAELETLFPHARAFVRPGLDEPTEVALLDLRERG